jgi:hypothetical protein
MLYQYIGLVTQNNGSVVSEVTSQKYCVFRLKMASEGRNM